MAIDERAARFKERVRARLTAMNTTQADLAREHGMTPQALSEVINGFPNIQFRSLEKLAAMLVVQTSWLIDGDPRDAYPDPKEVVEAFNG